MATVRFTNDLISDIKHKAKAPFDTKKGEIERSKNFDHWAHTIWKAIVGEHETALLSLPRSWMPATTRFSVKVPILGSSHHHHYIHAHAQQSYPMPREFGANDDIDAVTNSGYICISATSEVFKPLIEEVSEWAYQIKAVEKQRDTMMNGIDQLTKTYATLGPALKAWPALWDLLPESAKTKHKDVVKREKPEPKELKADLGAMTAALAVQKMMGKL
jgi:hypothetical protein